MKSQTLVLYWVLMVSISTLATVKSNGQTVDQKEKHWKRLWLCNLKVGQWNSRLPPTAHTGVTVHSCDLRKMPVAFTQKVTSCRGGRRRFSFSVEPMTSVPQPSDAAWLQCHAICYGGQGIPCPSCLHISENCRYSRNHLTLVGASILFCQHGTASINCTRDPEILLECDPALWCQ